MFLLATSGFTNKGFPIPMVKGVTFVNPSLNLGEVCFINYLSGYMFIKLAWRQYIIVPMTIYITI